MSQRRQGGGADVDVAALRRVQAYADLGGVALAWCLAWGSRRLLDPIFGYPINGFEIYAVTAPLVALVWVAAGWAFGVYRTPRLATPSDHVQSLGRGAVLGLALVAGLGFFAREWQFGRVVVLFSAAWCLVFQGATRLFFARMERGLREAGRLDVNVLILGAGVTGIRLVQKIQDHPEVGYRVVGFLDDDPSLQGEKVAGVPVLGGTAALTASVRWHGVSEVFVATPAMGHTRMLSLVLDCEDLGVTFRVVTNLFEVLTAGTSVELVDDLPLVRLGGAAPGPLYEPAKRVLDVAGALLALALSAPLWAWVAWRIRREGPGPVFFRQERVGRSGKRFRIVKFRTMEAGVEPYAAAPRRGDDPRITRFGAFLRRTSIDELPQLLNVLRGEMSLVGPRPEMPFIVEQYDDWQRRRLAVKPGITGLWQILGRKDLPMHDNLQYDFYYIRNRSLWMDLSLLLRTVGAVFSRRGAY